jgi:uncharacterized protein involved in exopolysaccharide biosynthesis
MELMGIVRRRKKAFVATFALIFLTCTIVAFVLPPIYTSEVTIVVENQEIPKEYVKSTITTFISERLELLEQSILSYTKLLDIIKANDLYPEATTNGEMVELMREDVEIKTIDISMRDRSGGKAGSATIAFKLAYDHKNPAKAKTVTDTLAHLFVDEDQKTRSRQAATTTLFLEKELDELRRQVKLNEEKISRFKAANIDQLPGSTGVFSQTVFRLEQELDKIDTRIRTLHEKIVYLRSQIANIDPLIPIMTEDGQVASNPNNRLKYLRLQLIRKQSALSDKHPDIIQLKNEIKELEAQVGQKDSVAEQVNRLTTVEKEIAELNSKYGSRHPDVIRMTREADLLKRQIDAAQSRPLTEEEQSDNPGYMNIKAQIIVAESEINALQDERIKVSNNLADYQRRLEMAPFIDEEYNALTLDYQNAKNKFNEVSNKLHSARISQEMDTSERGERFRIDRPANLPDKPSAPNRLLIILMGFVLGIGCGILLAALNEGLDSSVKATDELETIIGVPVLATVSFVDTPLQRQLRRSRRLVMVATVLMILFVASFLVNWLVMPIGDLWDKFEDRLVEIGVPIEKETRKL